MFLRLFILCLISSLLSSCYTARKTTSLTSADKNLTWKSEIIDIICADSTFRTSHTGLFVKPLNSEEPIISIKPDHYFTPASNTKLLTFLTCLHILQDRITGLKVYETEDSIIIWGTGDASFLNPFLEVNDYISPRFSATDKPIFFSTSNFANDRYGSGWSWDDYNYAYQTDIHSLPMYGNLVHFEKPLTSSVLKVSPGYFRTLTAPDVDQKGRTFVRKEHMNLFTYNPGKLANLSNVNRYVPYLSSDVLQASLLEDLLGREVRMIDQQRNIGLAEKIPSVSADSLYRLLLQPSDNFVAEQLLLNCGSELFDTLNTSKVIRWARENVLMDMPHEYQWVDGSGLSRYNMITPANMVHVLKLLHEKVDEDRLFRLLPTGGESGTIKGLYTAEEPFIHAKTGSLRNNHSLSGYLIGDSGKTYVFSFMNSNYLVSNRELKQGMDRVLRILKRNL